jgi:hypothetical protein
VAHPDCDAKDTQAQSMKSPKLRMADQAAASEQRPRGEHDNA